MSPSLLWRRSTHRILHLAIAAIVGTVLYSPLRAMPEAIDFVQFVAFPLLVASGLLLWKAPQLRRRYREQAGGDAANR